MPAIALRNVSIELSRTAIVKHASFALEAGQLTAIIGPNGAGKSTLLRAIAGILPYNGEIRILGNDAQCLTGRTRAKLISYLAQNESVAWPMPVESVVAIGRLPYLKASLTIAEADRITVARALERTKLTAFADRPIDSLSHGERSRVLLARALAVQAPILLADEPMAALDPRFQLQTMDILAEEAKCGAAVVAVMHDLALAAAYASRIVLMHEGRVTGDGAPADVLTEDLLFKIYGVKLRNKDAPLLPHFRIAEN